MTLKQPDTEEGRLRSRSGEYAPVPKGAHTGAGILEPNELQDLVDALPEVVKAAAGVPLQFRIHITLGDGGDVPSETVTSLNELLESVSAGLRLTE